MRYWYRDCPICGPDGVLDVMKTNGDGPLFLLCDECFSRFDTPEEVDAGNARDVGDVKFTHASKDEIIAGNWAWFIQLEARIKLTGCRDAEFIERLFESNLVNVAYIDETTSDCIYVVSEPDVDMNEPKNYEWVKCVISNALERTTEQGVRIELERRSF